MTTVDILFYCATRPSERTALALANIREVYGIRSLSFDQQAGTLRIEYDATRLNAATITKLVRQTGLDVMPANLNDAAEEEELTQEAADTVVA